MKTYSLAVNECPTPIDNRDIIDDDKAYRKLKQDLLEHFDYEVIHPNIY